MEMETEGEEMKLRPGSWILMEYGYDYDEYYIAENINDEMFLVGSTRWLVSSSKWMKWSDMEERHIFLLGHGTKRWWWKWLPFRDLICPYSKPKQ